MAYDVGQDIEVKGSIYRIPKMDDVADAVVAFKEYSNSIPYSEYIQTRTIADSGRAVEPVTEEDNGKMIVVQVDTTLQFGDLPEGFSVACVADAGATITYQGVDKNGQKSTQYQVGTVVTVGGLNILSLASPYDGEIGGEGGGGGIALGTPPAPVLVDKDGNPDFSGGPVIYFTPGEPNENQSPAIFYSAKIRRRNGAPLTTEILTMDQDEMQIVVSGTTPFIDYIVDVYGINEEGKGETASTNAFQINFNMAYGGFEEIVNNYNGTGERWKVHTFKDGTTTLEVTENPRSFSVVLVGGGAGGSGSTKSCDGGPGCERGGSGGGGGNNYIEDEQFLEKDDLIVTVGNGGGPGGNGSCSACNPEFASCNGGCTNTPGRAGASGGVSTLGDLTAAGGVGVQQGGTPTNHYFTSNITGIDVNYGRNGGAAHNSGGKGIVVVAYQIGFSTTKQIESAETIRANREAIYATEWQALLDAEQRVIDEWEEDHKRRMDEWEKENGRPSLVPTNPAYDAAIDEAFND